MISTNNAYIIYGATPLHMAAEGGHLPLVQCLLEHGTDKDKTTNDGASPLRIVSQEGNFLVVQCLLEHEADNDKTDKEGSSRSS